MITDLTEAKQYLRVDYSDEDDLITGIIETAEQLVADTLRRRPHTAGRVKPVVKIAVLFAVAYLYEHRENANMNELTRNLRYILMTERRAVF